MSAAQYDTDGGSDCEARTLTRDNLFEMRPITPKDYGAVLDVYRQSEDFLALGPEPKASIAMVRKDAESAEREGARFCGIFATDGRMTGVAEFLPSRFEGNPQLVLPCGNRRPISARKHGRDKPHRYNELCVPLNRV